MIAAPIQCRTFAGHPHVVVELKVMKPLSHILIRDWANSNYVRFSSASGGQAGMADFMSTRPWCEPQNRAT
jgi:hypothetical protein